MMRKEIGVLTLQEEIKYDADKTAEFNRNSIKLTFNDDNDNTYKILDMKQAYDYYKIITNFGDFVKDEVVQKKTSATGQISYERIFKLAYLNKTRHIVRILSYVDYKQIKVQETDKQYNEENNITKKVN